MDGAGSSASAALTSELRDRLLYYDRQYATS
jgi:hypothetical protein